MNASDTAKVQRFLRQRFGNHKLTLARRENKDDSADLMLEDEFIGVVFQDNEDGETCYHVQISILEEDSMPYFLRFIFSIIIQLYQACYIYNDEHRQILTECLKLSTKIL